MRTRDHVLVRGEPMHMREVGTDSGAAILTRREPARRRPQLTTRAVLCAALAVTVVGATVLAGTGAARATASDGTLVLLVDTSGSMEGAPLRQAQGALATAIGATDQDRPVGLREFSGSCGRAGTRRLVPPGVGNRDRLRRAVGDLVAFGDTPMSRGLQAAVGDLDGARGGSIILISDGVNSCENLPRPCALSAGYAAQGIELVVHTIGFGANADEGELRCVADETGGSYAAAFDETTLLEAIERGAEPPEPIVDRVVVLVAVTVLAAAAWFVTRPATSWRQKRMLRGHVRMSPHGDRAPRGWPPGDAPGPEATGTVRLLPHGGRWEEHVGHEERR
jgi:Mg-chelatase subunit ChlD